jgi:hypothetical protein
VTLKKAGFIIIVMGQPYRIFPSLRSINKTDMCIYFSNLCLWHSPLFNTSDASIRVSSLQKFAWQLHTVK